MLLGAPGFIYTLLALALLQEHSRVSRYVDLHVLESGVGR